MTTQTERFVLNRLEDATGISGTGIIADGVRFRDGKCVLKWRGYQSSITIFESLHDLEVIHGHGGKTVVEWIDDHNR